MEKKRCHWETNHIDVWAYIGLILVAGHLKQNYASKEKIWSEKYGHFLFRAAFSLGRFKALTQFMRLDNKEDILSVERKTLSWKGRTIARKDRKDTVTYQ